jgi:hypothetical protein
VERMNQFFVTRCMPQNELDFDIPVRLGVPEFSFITLMCQLELFIGPNSIEVVPILVGICSEQELGSLYKEVCPRIYSILRSVIKEHSF